MMLNWFGHIDSNFQLIRLERLLTKKTKQTGDASLTPLSLSFGRVIAKKSEIPEETLLAYQKVAPGDLVINPLNLNFDLKSFRVGLSGLHGCLSSGYIVTEINKTLNKVYFNYLMHIYDILELKNLGGGVRQTVSFDQLKKEHVAIPHPSMQTAIANYLDYETARIDAEIKKEECRIELLEELLQATIFETVTKGLDKNAEMVDSGIDWIGEIPKGWEVSRLGDLCSIRMGYAYRMEDGALNPHTDYLPLIKMSNFKRGIKAILPLENQLYFSNKIAPGSILKKNEFIMGLSGSVENLYWHDNDEKWLVNQRIAIIYNTTKYTWFLMNCEAALNYLINATSGTAQINLSHLEVLKLPVPIPPKKEQEQIVFELEKTIFSIEKSLRNVQLKIELLKELKQATIYEAVTGKTKIPSHFYPKE